MTTRRSDRPRIALGWAAASAFALITADGAMATAQTTAQTSAPVPTAETVAPSSLRRLVQGEALLESVPERFDTVIVGNPEIVATSVVNATTLVLTAKTTGRTNVILLDETGAVQARWDFEVTSTARHRAAIYRGAELSMLTCDPICGPDALAEGPAPAP